MSLSRAASMFFSASFFSSSQAKMMLYPSTSRYSRPGFRSVSRRGGQKSRSSAASFLRAAASFPAGNSGGKPRIRGAFFFSDGAVGSFQRFPAAPVPGVLPPEIRRNLLSRDLFSGTRPDPRGIRLCSLSLPPGISSRCPHAYDPGPDPRAPASRLRGNRRQRPRGCPRSRSGSSSLWPL